MAKVFCVSGAPLVGKSAALAFVSRPGLVVLDNEWTFSMPMRVLCAKQRNLEVNCPVRSVLKLHTFHRCERAELFR